MHRINIRSRSPAFVSIFVLGINTISLVVFTPLFIDFLGSERYGYWLVIQAIISTCMLVEFGGYNTLARKIAVHSGEHQELWHGIAKTLYRKYFFQLMLAVIGVTPIVFYICRSMWHWDLGIAWLLVGLGAPLLLYIRMKSALLIGSQEISAERWLQCLNTVAGLVLGVGFCIIYPSLSSLALGGLLGNLIACWVSRSLITDHSKTVPREMIIDVISQARPQGVVNFSSFIMGGLSPVIVGLVIGGGQVVVYTLTTRVASLGIQLFQAMLNSQSSLWGKLYANNGLVLTSIHVRKFGRMLFPFVLFSFILYAWLCPYVIHFWTHGKVIVPIFLPILLAVSAIIVVYDNICAAFVNAVRVANQFQFSAICGAILYLLLTSILGHFYGVVGMSIGALIAHCATTTRAAFFAYIDLVKS